MVAFAGNSLLSRLALADDAIDPASFTVLRLVAGAVTLAAIVWLRRRSETRLMAAGSWRSAVTLFVYAVFFSYAYVSLTAATGALILFGFVQATMIAAGLLAGERAGGAEAAGWALAAVGLIVLLLPGATAPSWAGSLMMAVAGVGWGLYSLYGRGERQPLAATAGNFMRVLVPVAALVLVTAPLASVSPAGAAVACLTGSLTTGIGYVIWYAALPALTSLQAALVQLSVPAIAATGGILLLGEALNPRLVICGSLILGGIWLSLGSRNRRRAAS
jgi:drug/metabolite transporter (DMT)-like permease